MQELMNKGPSTVDASATIVRKPENNDSIPTAMSDEGITKAVNILVFAPDCELLRVAAEASQAVEQLYSFGHPSLLSETSIETGPINDVTASIPILKELFTLATAQAAFMPFR